MPASGPDLPLFTYGTLLEPGFTANLLEHPVRAEPAILVDFARVELHRFDFAAVVETPGSTVEGRIYRRLTPEDYLRLDAYEGVAEGLYRRVTAEVVSPEEHDGAAPEPVFVYVPTRTTLKRC